MWGPDFEAKNSRATVPLKQDEICESLTPPPWKHGANTIASNKSNNKSYCIASLLKASGFEAIQLLCRFKFVCVKALVSLHL